MRNLSVSIQSLLVGAMLAGVGAVLLLLFADAFRDGATWSPVTQRGGPGFMFVVGPALVGWFWAASLVKAHGSTATLHALGISLMASIGVAVGGVALGRSWSAAPVVLESLFSTIAVALMVGTVASVSVRLTSQPHRE
jgi:hypothetical protein